MKRPKVSVIITTYNREKFLRETITSVLSQSYNDFELIIIDDGSTDKTKDIVDSFTDERISYYYQQNKGQNIARNLGMSISQGEYIAHVDSDDLWINTKLEKQVKILNEKKDIGLVYCGTKLIDCNSEFVKKLKIHNHNGYVLDKLLMSNFLYNGSNTLFRKTCLTKVVNFDESVNRMTDWQFYLKFSIYYKFYSIPEYLVLYRVHDTNMSINYIKYKKNGFKILYKAFKSPYIIKNYSNLKRLAYAMRYRFLAHRCLELNHTKELRYYAGKAIRMSPNILYRSNLLLIIFMSFCSQWFLNILREARYYYTSKMIAEDILP